MIVSHKHRFIFLKTRKTAGTSVEVALSQIAGDDAIVTPVKPVEPGHEPRNHRTRARRKPQRGLPLRGAFRSLVLQPRTSRDYARYIDDAPFIGYFNHMPAWLARAKLGEEVWNGYFKFCFERNPWDKVVSMYSWNMRDHSSPRPFEAWLRTAADTSDWPIYAIDHSCAVDEVGRYENLTADLARLLERAGTTLGDLELPRSKAGFRRRDCLYSPTEVEHVRQVFHREVEMHGYECPPHLLQR